MVDLLKFIKYMNKRSIKYQSYQKVIKIRHVFEQQILMCHNPNTDYLNLNFDLNINTKV